MSASLFGFILLIKLKFANYCVSVEVLLFDWFTDCIVDKIISSSSSVKGM